jgi:hypothetical protein
MLAASWLLPRMESRSAVGHLAPLHLAQTTGRPESGRPAASRKQDMAVHMCKSHQGWFRSLRRAMGGWWPRAECFR